MLKERFIYSRFRPNCNLYWGKYLIEVYLRISEWPSVWLSVLATRSHAVNTRLSHAMSSHCTGHFAVTQSHRAINNCSRGQWNSKWKKNTRTNIAFTAQRSKESFRERPWSCLYLPFDTLIVYLLINAFIADCSDARIKWACQLYTGTKTGAAGAKGQTILFRIMLLSSLTFNNTPSRKANSCLTRGTANYQTHLNSRLHNQFFLYQKGDCDLWSSRFCFPGYFDVMPRQTRSIPKSSALLHFKDTIK
jgi:hypothetical protein